MKRLLIILFLLGVGLGVLTAYSIDDAPTISQSVRLSQSQLVRIEHFIRANNPEDIKAGKITQTRINQPDLNLLMSYILQRMEVNIPSFEKRRVGGLVALNENNAKIQFSIGLSEYGSEKFLNVSAGFSTDNKDDVFTYKLNTLSIGEITVPSIVANFLAHKTHEKLKENFDEYDLVSQSIKNLEVGNQNLTVKYYFDKKVVENIQRKLTARVIPENLRQALIAQSNQLAYSSQRLELQPSINELFKPMFALAQERSIVNDPIIENKAVFIVLGSYSINKSITKYFDEKNQYAIRPYKIYLNKRHDLSKHFLVSAAISSMVDKALAKTIGLKKEEGDSDGGSGFSFVDMAANYAGIRLASFAIENETQARQVQYYLAEVKLENEYMPSTDKLAEGIFRTDLGSSFKSSEQYMKTEALIIERIQQLSIYKKP